MILEKIENPYCECTEFKITDDSLGIGGRNNPSMYLTFNKLLELHDLIEERIEYKNKMIEKFY